MIGDGLMPALVGMQHTGGDLSAKVADRGNMWTLDLLGFLRSDEPGVFGCVAVRAECLEDVVGERPTMAPGRIALDLVQRTQETLAGEVQRTRDATPCLVCRIDRDLSKKTSLRMRWLFR